MVSVCPRQVGNMGQSDRVTVTVVDERAIYQQAFNDAKLRDSRGTERQANRPSPLHDVRVLHHGLNRAIRSGVHAGPHRVLVHARLVGRIRFDAAVPIEVIGVHVQADGSKRAHRVGGMQLEARQLNGEYLGVGVNRARDRGTNIADFLGLDTRCAQDLPQHANRRRLAVRARHSQPRATGVRSLLLETPGQLHLAPQVDSRLRAGLEHGVMRGDTGGHDDEVGACLQHRAHQGVCVLLNVDANVRDLVEKQRRGGASRKSAHAPVAGQKSARGTLAGLTPTNNSSTAAHRADTHSA